MSHRNDCPQPWEARREGYRSGEYETYGRNPYKSSFDNEGCDEAARHWERGKWDAEYDREREEEQAQEDERRERARQEERHLEELREEQYRQDMIAEGEQDNPEPQHETPDDEMPF